MTPRAPPELPPQPSNEEVPHPVAGCPPRAHRAGEGREHRRQGRRPRRQRRRPPAAGAPSNWPGGHESSTRKSCAALFAAACSRAVPAARAPPPAPRPPHEHTPSRSRQPAPRGRPAGARNHPKAAQPQRHLGIGPQRWPRRCPIAEALRDAHGRGPQDPEGAARATVVDHRSLIRSPWFRRARSLPNRK